MAALSRLALSDQAIVQRPTRHSQHSGGNALNSIGPSQRLLDGQVLDLLEGWELFGEEDRSIA